MLVIAALQENQGQPIKASHIVTDVYIKKSNQGGREITEARLNIQREAVQVGMRDLSPLFHQQHHMVVQKALPLYDPVHGSGPGEIVLGRCWSSPGSCPIP
jgi:hypothetical protein